MTDYSTKNKINITKDEKIYLFIHTVIYTFMDNPTRTSTSMYISKGTKLLRLLHMICAAIDTHTKTRAKKIKSNIFGLC